MSLLLRLSVLVIVAAAALGVVGCQSADPKAAETQQLGPGSNPSQAQRDAMRQGHMPQGAGKGK